jgi:hypothetical protein
MNSAHRGGSFLKIQSQFRFFLRRAPVALRLPMYFRQYDKIKGKEL